MNFVHEKNPFKTAMSGGCRVCSTPSSCSDIEGGTGSLEDLVGAIDYRKCGFDVQTTGLEVAVVTPVRFRYDGGDGVVVSPAMMIDDGDDSTPTFESVGRAPQRSALIVPEFSISSPGNVKKSHRKRKPLERYSPRGLGLGPISKVVDGADSVTEGESDEREKSVSPAKRPRKSKGANLRELQEKAEQETRDRIKEILPYREESGSAAVKIDVLGVLSEPPRCGACPNPGDGVVSFLVSTRPALLAMTATELGMLNPSAVSRLRRGTIGCTIKIRLTSDSPRTILDLNTFGKILSLRIREIASNASISVESVAKQLARQIFDTTNDDMATRFELFHSYSSFHNMRSRLKGKLLEAWYHELNLWNEGTALPSSIGVRYLTRLIQPVCAVVLVGQSWREEIGSKGDFASVGTQDDDLFGEQTNSEDALNLSFSLLDLVLFCDDLRTLVIEAMCHRMAFLHIVPGNADTIIFIEFLKALKRANSAKSLDLDHLEFRLCLLLGILEHREKRYLEKLIAKHIPLLVDMNILDDDDFLDELAYIKAPHRVSVTEEPVVRMARSNPMSSPRMRAVETERRRLIRRFEKYVVQGYSSFETREPKGLSNDGFLILSEKEVSLERFLEMNRTMRRVNNTFRRQYLPGSKPTLAQLQLSPADVKKLRDLFFDSDGCLKVSVMDDLDYGGKSDPRYIEFQNSKSRLDRKDTRWQVPLAHHHDGGKVVSSRQIVEDIMTKAGMLMQGYEALDDIGLLFGGTEDQSLHHDTSRMVVHWTKERPLIHSDEWSEFSSLVGWEIDRLEYNAAMASPYAPSSLLVGLHGGEHVLLGVQKNTITRTPGGKTCSIIGGRPNEIFPIVRENDDLAVLKIRTGAIFTGDFNHAGVRNFAENSEEILLMDKLNAQVKAINETTYDDLYIRTKRLAKMMSKFKGLDRLCRLHCSTKMLTGARLIVPPNTVGFEGCRPNPP